MPPRRRARQCKEQVTRFGAALAVVSLLVAGCGDDDDPPEPLAAPALTIDGSRVSIACFGADCSVFIHPDGDLLRVSVNRAVGGTAIGRSEVLPLPSGITDIEIDLGTGNDRFVIQNYVVSGTLRVAMGDGDDELRVLDDGGALGTMDVDLGAGDDEVVIRAACFPYGNVVRGGTGTDFLFGTAKLVAQAGTLDGFEERTLGFGGFAGLSESCRDLE
jgi:hypothetical protein